MRILRQTKSYCSIVVQCQKLETSSCLSLLI